MDRILKLLLGVAIATGIFIFAINHWVLFSIKRAIDSRDVTSVKNALLNGYNPNSEFRFGWLEYRTMTRPLHYAVMEGDVEIVKTLIQFSADPNLCDYNRRTALMTLFDSEINSRFRNQLFDILVPITKLEIQDVDGYNVLHFAAMFGSQDEYNAILKIEPGLAQVTDKVGIAPPEYFKKRTIK